MSKGQRGDKRLVIVRVSCQDSKEGLEWGEDFVQVWRIQMGEIYNYLTEGEVICQKVKWGLDKRQKGDTFEMSWEEKDERLYARCAKSCFHGN